jgi:hypothetical protein
MAESIKGLLCDIGRDVMKLQILMLMINYQQLMFVIQQASGNCEKLEVGWQTLGILMGSVLWGDLFGESIFLVTTPNQSNGLPSEKICWPRLFVSHNM